MISQCCKSKTKCAFNKHKTWTSENAIKQIIFNRTLYKKLTSPRKLPGPWTTSVLNSISLQCIPWPVACSEWGACGVLRANDPWMESFCKSSGIANKKNSGVGDTFEPPITAPHNKSRLKFRKCCRPLTCACVPTLVQIGYGLPDLFRKESKKVNTKYTDSLLRACYVTIGSDRTRT